MTLNELAIKMWERLDCQGMDASVLSKVLKGERIFNLRQLNTFCDILNSSSEERKILVQSLEDTLLSKYGFSHDDDKNDSWLVDAVNKVQQVRLSGLVDLAISWCNQLFPYFELNSSNHHLEIFTRLIREYIVCISVTAQSEVAGQLIIQKSNLLLQIANKTNNENTYKQAQYHLANAYYVIKNYLEAIKHYKIALTANLSPLEKAITISSALVASASIKNQENFDYFKEKAEQFLPFFENDAATTLYGGLARAEAIRGNDSLSVKYFELAEVQNNLNVAKRGPQHILKTIQLRRTQIEIFRNCKNTFSKSTIEKVCLETVFLARQFGYVRYANQISSYLSEI
jgi:tetratricopeptide (TPR) repeat protein